ncbi:hypothetical protein ILUMI_04411 [Ignelater luminosus]|uniref:Uncharacterized protein n=1 Tax=Ignelater luminosus TaxID=2038154 RepID=A0A8K0D913_IGNLU|nr:hypothetical protein ILUMI_04411 [Ignelater luminosus]
MLAPKGVKQISRMTIGEKGVNVTMNAAISATGNSIPPMLIFPRVNFKDFIMKGAPSGAIGAAVPSGWHNKFLPFYVTDRLLPDALTTSSDVLSSPASPSRLDTTTNPSIISPEILKPFSKSQARKPSQKGRQEEDHLNISSNLDDDFSLSEEIEAQKLEKQFESELINERDFILIKFLGKQYSNYFVAKVVSKDSNEINVKYLKKNAFSNKFLLEAIVLKLPPPITLGSARQQSHLTFPVDSRAYNVV